LRFVGRTRKSADEALYEPAWIRAINGGTTNPLSFDVHDGLY